MTPEQFHQIEELYHQAREDRGLLNGMDLELRREVESLLAHDRTPLPALAVGAVLGEGRLDEPTAIAFAPGTLLGPYVIEAMLGVGGMGMVYRALDTKLDRAVAIKLISDELADATARRRFQREARMASSLNHPHILTVHDAGEYEGRQYLVTEFVDGGTLKEWMKAERRTWRQIVDLLVGVADGLAAAHRAGILHRDIKPANILVAQNGYAKLADFGVAKLEDTRRDEATPTRTEDRTRPGIVVGTVAYMSPEQVQGRPTDARSDIFSFGIVLYEMLNGRRPFAGGTDLEVCRNIVHGIPEALPVDLPVRLRTSVEKALEKNPGDRYQTASDLVVDLRHALRTEVGTAESAKRRPLWLWILLAAAVVLAGALYWVRQHDSPPENPLADATFTRLTDYEGAELDASISPDGKFVAFLSDQGGPFGVWLIQVGAGKAINLTPGTEDESAPLRSIGFSGNGTEIWLAGTDTRRVRMLPMVGGEPRVFLGNKAVSPMLSPDGKRLAYHTLEAGDPIYVGDRDGSNARQIFKDRADKHNHYLEWGADGEWIYFIHGTPATKKMDLWRIRASGGEPEQLTHQNSDMRDPTPLAAQTILYLARESNGSGPSIWVYDLAHKVSRRLTFGLETYTSLSASADGRKLAAIVANPKVGIWTVAISDGVAQESDVKSFALPSKRALKPRLRGNALYFLSSLGSGDGLWRFEDGKAVEVWRSAQGELLEAPAISPDGRRIAIVVRNEGKHQLRLITADGAESNAVAQEIDIDGSADWSPDGNWIVTSGNDGKGEGLFKVPTGGGASVRLTNGVGRDPVWSPDGSLIVYSGPNVFTLTPLLAVRPDGNPVEMPPIQTQRDGERLRFLPDSGGLVYMQGSGSTPWQDFWLLDLKSRKTRQLTKLNNRSAMGAFDISPDGKKIVFDRLRENSSVVLIDLHTRP